MEILIAWATVAFIVFIASISPGPDLIMIIRNSLQSRAVGLWTAFGLGLGVAVHVTYCIMGLAVLISESIIIFNIIKWIGASYLIWIGFKALKSKGYSGDITEKEQLLPLISAIKSGFITNLFNPKATLFFLALFTQIISPETSIVELYLYGATSVAIVAGWFAIVAIFLTVPFIRERFFLFSKWVDKICGALFIALGIKLAITKANN